MLRYACARGRERWKRRRESPIQTSGGSVLNSYHYCSLSYTISPVCCRRFPGCCATPQKFITRYNKGLENGTADATRNHRTIPATHYALNLLNKFNCLPNELRSVKEKRPFLPPFFSLSAARPFYRGIFLLQSEIRNILFFAYFTH